MVYEIHKSQVYNIFSKFYLAIHLVFSLEHYYLFSEVWVGWEFSTSFYFFFLKNLPLTSSIFSCTIKQTSRHTFNTLLISLLSSIHKFITNKYYFPRTKTQFIQAICHFITRINFSAVSNVFLISVWDLTRSTSNIHISTNILFVMIYL